MLSASWHIAAAFIKYIWIVRLENMRKDKLWPGFFTNFFKSRELVEGGLSMNRAAATITAWIGSPI